MPLEKTSGFVGVVGHKEYQPFFFPFCHSGWCLEEKGVLDSKTFYSEGDGALCPLCLLAGFQASEK